MLQEICILVVRCDAQCRLEGLRRVSCGLSLEGVLDRITECPGRGEAQACLNRFPISILTLSHSWNIKVLDKELTCPLWRRHEDVVRSHSPRESGSLLVEFWGPLRLNTHGIRQSNRLDPQTKVITEQADSGEPTALGTGGRHAWMHAFHKLQKQ